MTRKKARRLAGIAIWLQENYIFKGKILQ